MKTVEKLYTLFLRAASSLQSPFLLAVRLYWGWQFHLTGHGKLADISKPIDYFGSLGIPAPAVNAWFVTLVEFVGGFLLIAGLASRPAALLLTIDMIVAYVVADREALLSIFSDPDKFMAATPFTFLFASLIILIFGPGKVSFDTLLARRRGKKQPGDAQRS